MNKSMIYLAATIGGIIGGYLPVVLFHAGSLSAWSILGSLVGGIGGIWAAVKINNSL
jgi:drug/metabolite transporter superfamily protein YnfA